MSSKRRLYLLKKPHGDFIVAGWAKYSRGTTPGYQLCLRVRVLWAFNGMKPLPRTHNDFWGTREYETHFPGLEGLRARFVRRLRVL